MLYTVIAAGAILTTTSNSCDEFPKNLVEAKVFQGNPFESLNEFTNSKPGSNLPFVKGKDDWLGNTVSSFSRWNSTSKRAVTYSTDDVSDKFITKDTFEILVSDMRLKNENERAIFSISLQLSKYQYLGKNTGGILGTPVGRPFSKFDITYSVPLDRISYITVTEPVNSVQSNKEFFFFKIGCSGKGIRGKGRLGSGFLGPSPEDEPIQEYDVKNIEGDVQEIFFGIACEPGEANAVACCLYRWFEKKGLDKDVSVKYVLE